MVCMGRTTLSGAGVPPGGIVVRYALVSVAIAATSWFHYGGPGLVCPAAEPAPQQALALAARDTIFLREEAGELRQVLHISVLGDWEKRGIFRVEAGGKSFQLDAEKAPA